MGDQVKGRSMKKLESLIEVPYVVHVKVHVLSFNIIHIHLRRVFLHRVIHFGENLGDKVKGRSPKKVKVLIEVPKVLSSESTCFYLQYYPSLISVPCSWTESSISEKLWEIRKRVVYRKG